MYGLKKVYREQPNLTAFGFEKNTQTQVFKNDRLELAKSKKEFSYCMEWLIDKLNSNDQKKSPAYLSMPLKHMVQDWVKKYEGYYHHIPNGVFIAAVIYLKIPYEVIENSMNILVKLNIG